MTTINMHVKFEIEIPKQAWLTSRKPCHLQSPETEKSNMATRRPFWKWRCWKSIGSYPYTKVLWRWSLKLIFKAKVKLESGNQKIQYGRQWAILKVTSLKINRLLPMATINMHMKFEIEIPKQTWLMLRKPCRLQTDGRTDGRTRWIQYTPHSNFVGRGYNYSVVWYIHTKATFIKDMDQPSQTHLPHSTKLAFTLPVTGHSCDSIFLGCTLKLSGMLRCHIRFCGANQ